MTGQELQVKSDKKLQLYKDHIVEKPRVTGQKEIRDTRRNSNEFQEFKCKICLTNILLKLRATQ